MTKGVTGNWNKLHAQMTTIVADLKKIDPSKELTPRTKLAPIRANVATVMQLIKQRNLSKIGKHFIARDVAFVLNSLNSVDAALKEQSITRARMGEVLSAAGSRINALRSEIEIHVEHKLLLQAAEANLQKQEAKTNKPVAELEANVKNSQSFSDFSSAMRNLIDHVVAAEKEEEDEAENEIVVHAAAMSEVRERHLFQAIGGEYDSEIKEIRAKLAKFHPSEDAMFTFLRMPVVVISNKQIPTRGLDAAGIKYKVVPFSGIQFGTSPGGRREQSDTHGVILNDQLVAAIPNKIDAAPKPTNRKPAAPQAPMTTLRTRGGGQKVESSQGFGGVDLDLTRKQIPAILKIRSGREFVDVLGTSGVRTSFLVSRQLPGFKFIWLLPKQQYSHIGNLNMREVGLPFRASGQ